MGGFTTINEPPTGGRDRNSNSSVHSTNSTDHTYNSEGRSNMVESDSESEDNYDTEPRRKKRKTESPLQTGKTRCSECGSQITTQNIARHRALHNIPVEFKTLREWCPTCEFYFAHGQRKRHFETYHDGMETKTKEEAYIWDPKKKQRFRPRSMINGAKQLNGRRGDEAIPRPVDDEEEDDRGDQTNRATRGGESPVQNTVVQSETSILAVRTTKSPSSHSPVDLPDVSRIQPSLLVPSSKLLLEAYHKRMDRDIKSIKARMAELSLQCKDGGTMTSRFRGRYEKYHKILKYLKPAHLITATQYAKMVDRGDTEIPGHRCCYVVCSNKEAKEILKNGQPILPLVIPQAAKPEQSVEAYLEYLSNSTSIDVHDFGEGDDEDWNGFPEALTGEDAVARFRSDDGTTVNFLNLACVKGNPYPMCTEGSRALSILRELKRGGQAGKVVKEVASDLTNSATFTILGKRDVFSFPHWDHYGMMTTIFIEEGLKGWFTWPQMDEDEKFKWARLAGQSQFPMPGTDCFVIPLRTGDLLVQPGQTVHAPFTMESTLATGTQHLQSDAMSFHLAAAVIDARWPDATNEDAAIEAIDKFQMIGEAWKRRTTAWPWGNDEDLAEFDALLLALRKQLGVFQFTCKCKKGCDAARCICKKNNVDCNPGCGCRKSGANDCTE